MSYGISTFVVGCFIIYHDSDFHAYLDIDLPFFNLKDNIVYFKTKGDIIEFGNSI